VEQESMAAASHSGDDAVSLQGRLRSFRLFDLLTLLHICRKTGTLRLSFSGIEVVTYLRDGQLIFATTDQERLRLGAVLRARNLLTPEQATQIAVLQEGGQEKFGQIALRLGLMNEAQLQDALKIQVSEIVYDCLPRLDGTFAFIEGMSLPEYAVTIAIDVPNLIMEGARRIGEWEECLQLLPDDQEVFRVVDQPAVQEKITLSIEEWKVLFRIDGRKPLAQVVEEAALEPLIVYRIVYGLLASNLIEADPSAKRTQPQAPSPEPAEDRRALTGPITGAIHEITDEEWEEFKEDDTRLLISKSATWSLQAIREMAVEVARFQAKLPGGSKTFHPLVDDQYVIGRSGHSDIRFDESSVSARHAKVVRTKEGYVIEDLESRNGTFVNDKPIEKLLLRDGDVVRIGRIVLVYDVVYNLV
jgi:hypothetical protein